MPDSCQFHLNWVVCKHSDVPPFCFGSLPVSFAAALDVQSLRAQAEMAKMPECKELKPLKRDNISIRT